MYLFDILCSHSFFDPIIHSDTLLFIKEIHQKNLINDSGTGFISWITGINYSGYKLIFPSSSPQFTYLAFFLLQAEDHHIRETGLWTEIVEQLSLNRSVEEAVAAAANKCERSPPLCGQLPVYRWLQQAIDTPPQHPLQPLLWQRFFHCFLSRPHPSHGGSEPRGIGMSFFSGMINSLCLSKVKKALSSRVLPLPAGASLCGLSPLLLLLSGTRLSLLSAEILPTGQNFLNLFSVST